MLELGYYTGVQRFAFYFEFHPFIFLMPCPEYEINNNINDTMTLSCQTDWLGQQLDNGKELLILDCRSPNDYNTSHIQGAIHVAIPSLMMRRLKKGNLSVCSVINSPESREKFNKKWKTETLVVYDECTSDINANTTSVVSLLMRRLKEDGCRVCLLEGKARLLHWVLL